MSCYPEDKDHKKQCPPFEKMYPEPMETPWPWLEKHGKKHKKHQEIDCLKVKKVFEECSRTFVAKVKIPVSPPHPGRKVKCGKATVYPKKLDCEIIPECSTVSLVDNELAIKISAFLVHDEHMHPVEACGKLVIPEKDRDFVLERAGEEDLDCEVEIFAECLECFISCKSHNNIVSEITCCIGILIIVKLVSEVQLLIPTFGYCPVPPKCEEKKVCRKEYDPLEIPYPRQTEKKHCNEEEEEKEGKDKKKESKLWASMKYDDEDEYVYKKRSRKECDFEEDDEEECDEKKHFYDKEKEHREEEECFFDFDLKKCFKEPRIDVIF